MMKHYDSIRQYSYCSNLAENIIEFVKEKRGLGYSYNTEAKILKRFDTFADDFGCTKNALNRELVEAWVSKKDNESNKYQKSRISIIQLFAKSMMVKGYPAYIVSKDCAEKGVSKFVPYIFTKEELKRFFTACDGIEPNPNSPNRYLIIPMIFRILYGCGLRVSEAINLKIKDIDLENGVLTIREAKYGKERLIPMTLGLTKQCEVFCSKIHLGSNSESYFFPAPDGRLYSTKAIYDNFRLMLFAANISHGGKGYGPRVHDFRHTFAVHSLKQWALQGQDIYVCLPILSTYLGHSGITATSQYLRLTADLFPSITDIMSKNFGSPILERPTIKSQQGKSTKTESKFNARSLIASKKIAGLNCPACNKDSQCAQVALPQSLILTAVIV